jgi:hypothetical protein
MNQSQFERLTDAQKKAMRDLVERSGISWEIFLQNALAPAGYQDYVAIPDFHGMYVGIESDGYTHS